MNGLSTTFRVLGQSKSECANLVLRSALDQGRPSIQEAALRALLKQWNPAGPREILARWGSISDRWHEIVRENPGRMISVLREGVASSSASVCARSCSAALYLEEYDLIPTILTTLQNQLTATGDTLATTLLLLADKLYEELATKEPGSRRRDPQAVREHVIRALEPGVQRYAGHRRREVLEAFLVLVDRSNVVLRQVLQDPHHSAFTALMDVLLHSSRPGVSRLLLNFLEDTHPPSAALSVVGNRCDMPFLRHLLRKLGREPSATVRQNLKRITQVACLRSPLSLLADFDDSLQQAFVQYFMGSGAPRPQAFSAIEAMLRSASPAGRRAAAEALDEFNGAEANGLALKALKDPDAQVQAEIVGQLRRRGIPGILLRLVDLLESPHVVVRQAARRSLSEFTFARYLGAFDMLDDEVRRSTGMLVKKVDPQTIPMLEGELRSPTRTRRVRGLAIARTLELVEQLEDLILSLLQDEDHMVRAEAAECLARSLTTTSQQALENALHDRAMGVQEAARKSLEARHQFAQWRSAHADPRD